MYLCIGIAMKEHASYLVEGNTISRIPALVACLSSNRVVNSSPIGVPVNKKLPFFCHRAQQLLVLLSIDFWLAASSSCQICSPPSILLNTFLHCGFCVRDNWASLQPANQVKIKVHELSVLQLTDREQAPANM